MGRRDQPRRHSRKNPAVANASDPRRFLQPEPRSTALALLKFFEEHDFAAARELAESIPAEESAEVLLALAFTSVTFLDSWVDARGFAGHPAYEGLTGAALRVHILQELLSAAATGADGIGGAQ